MMSQLCVCSFFFFSSRRRHTRFDCDWSSDVCSSDLQAAFFMGFLGYALHAFGFVMAGVIIYAVLFLFHLVTLPVEFDASSRAKVQRSEERRVGEESRSRGAPDH